MFLFNGVNPNKVVVNGAEAAKVVYNGVVVWRDNEYTNLEYIESNGTQWIDTLISPDPLRSYKIETGVCLTSVTDELYIVGCDFVNASQNRLTLAGMYQAKFLVGRGSWSFASPVISRNTWHQISSFNAEGTQKFRLDDVNVFSGDMRQGNKAFLSNIKIFSCTSVDSGKQYSASCKMRRTKIFEDEILVRDFLPVRRNADGTVGMYDTVSKRFFGNQGTGEFVAGAATPINNAN